MPAPFAWIAIPKKGYSIAKYPVTNAQFRKFIEAGGYGLSDDVPELILQYIQREDIAPIRKRVEQARDRL